MEKDPEKTMMIKSTGKDFKTSIISTFNNLKENMTVISRKTEYFNYNQRAFLYLKNTLSNLKRKSLTGLTSKLETIRENINEFKGIEIEII